MAGGARHRTRQATAHTQQQEQQQEQQDEHKELEKQEVQELKEQDTTPYRCSAVCVICRCSRCCSCTAVICVASLTHRHDRVEELSETRQCADKTCHIHRGQQCSNHQQHTIGRCRQHSERSGPTVGDLSATMMSGSGVDAAAVARYTAPSRRRDDATTRSHRSQRRVHTALACTSDATSCRPCSMARGCRIDSVQHVSSSAAIRATHDSHGRDNSSIDGRQPWRESLPDLGYI